MSVYKSIMQGLDDAVNYQEGKIDASKTKIAVKPVESFTNEDIKQIRKRSRLKPGRLRIFPWGIQENS